MAFYYKKKTSRFYENDTSNNINKGSSTIRIVNDPLRTLHVPVHGNTQGK